MKWRWSPELRQLFKQFEVRVVEDRSTNYEETSNPGSQMWDGTVLRVHPDRTDDGDLVHEIAHYLECLRDRPAAMVKVNWGQEELKGWADRDWIEAVACDIDVGLHVLWEWDWWSRAQMLNLPDWWDQTMSEEDHAERLRRLALDYLGQ